MTQRKKYEHSEERNSSYRVVEGASPTKVGARLPLTSRSSWSVLPKRVK